MTGTGVDSVSLAERPGRNQTSQTGCLVSVLHTKKKQDPRCTICRLKVGINCKRTWNVWTKKEGEISPASPAWLSPLCAHIPLQAMAATSSQSSSQTYKCFDGLHASAKGAKRKSLETMKKPILEYQSNNLVDRTVHPPRSMETVSPESVSMMFRGCKLLGIMSLAKADASKSITDLMMFWRDSWEYPWGSAFCIDSPGMNSIKVSRTLRKEIPRE